MHFDDLSVGDVLEPRTVDSVREEDAKLVAALLEDPYRPHFDERFASDLGYPTLLNQGPINLSYLLQTITRHLERPSDVRSFDMQFRDMVFVGDDVVATATVEEKRVVDGDGIVDFSLALEREDGTVAVEGSVSARFPHS